jgi:hypothetical protein
VKTVISLFDYSGVALEPWAEAGYRCIAIDIQKQERRKNGITFVQADLLRWCLPYGLDLAMILAWPPCTHLAVSGSRWFKGKGLDALADAIRLVAAAARICEAGKAPYLIENPVSTLATYWRKPDFRFDPCDYAGYLEDPSPEAYTKSTCFWTGNGFVMPPPKRVEPVLGSKMHLLPPSEDRANLRSETPMGLSRALFAANHLKIAA